MVVLSWHVLLTAIHLPTLRGGMEYSFLLFCLLLFISNLLLFLLHSLFSVFFLVFIFPSSSFSFLVLFINSFLFLFFPGSLFFLPLHLLLFTLLCYFSLFPSGFSLFSSGFSLFFSGFSRFSFGFSPFSSGFSLLYEFLIFILLSFFLFLFLCNFIFFLFFRLGRAIFPLSSLLSVSVLLSLDATRSVKVVLENFHRSSLLGIEICPN